MTIAHGQAIALPTSHFVGWTRGHRVHLPFPLNTREQEYVQTPDDADLDRFLRAERLDESAVLDAAEAAFRAPALVVYAVRGEGAEPDAPETKYVAVSGRDPNSSVLVVLDSDHTTVRAIAETELAASVASTVPAPPGGGFAAFDADLPALSEAEDVCLSDASLRTKRAALNAAGLPPDFVAVREAMVDQPRTGLGLVSAVSHTVVDAGRPAAASAIWVETPVAAYLQLSLPSRGSRPQARVSPVGAEHLFRACADAITSCFAPGN